MTVKEFAASLAMSLMDRGIEKEDAARHVLTLTKTLTEEDLKEITEYKNASEFADLADGLADIIKRKIAKKRAMEQRENRTPQSTAPYNPEMMGTRVDTPVARSAEYTPYSTQTFENPVNISGEKIHFEKNMADTRTSVEPIGDEIILGDDSYIKEKTVLTSRGKVFYWLITVFSSPVWLAVVAFIAALFLLSVSTVCAFIAIVFLIVVGEIVVGGTGFFVGLVYGIMKMFSNLLGTGLYEMGVGVVCLGITVILAMATYYVATKTLPYLLKELLLFWGVVARRTEAFNDKFREECNKL